MSGYRSTGRALAAAAAGGLGLAVVGDRVAWALFSLYAVATNMRGDGYIAMFVLAPAGVVLCGIVGAIVASRSPRHLGAVLGAGIGLAVAMQAMVQPGYLGRPLEPVFGSFNDPLVILAGGAIGAVAGWSLAAAATSMAAATALIVVALAAYGALYFADDPTRWQLLMVRLQSTVGRTSDANLSGADLSNRRFANANLAGADLSHAIMWGTDLSGANLSGANLTGAQLGGARMAGANLSGANLSLAQLGSADLRGANLDGAQISQGQLDATVSYRGALNLPNGLRPDTRPVRAGYPPPYP